MASGHLTYKPGTGHLAYSENGHLALDCGAPDTCGNCADGTPSQYDVTFDSVVMATVDQCYDNLGYGTASAVLLSGVLDGTYRLTYEGTGAGICYWRSSPVSISHKYCTWVDCATGCTTDDFIITLALGVGGGYVWRLAVQSAGAILFVADASPSGNCETDLPSFTNSLAAFGWSTTWYLFRLGKDGTASVALV